MAATPNPPRPSEAQRLALSVAAFLRNHETSHPQARVTAPLSRDEAARWLAASESMAAVIARWVRAGIRDPRDRPEWMGPNLAAHLADLGLSPVTADWVDANKECLGALRHLLPERRSAAETLGLARAARIHAQTMRPVQMPPLCREDTCLCGLPERVALIAREAAAVAARDGLGWADLALCLTAGMEVGEAADYVRSGGDIGSVRVMVGLT